MAGETRSPRYPSIGLADAVELIQKIWESEKRTPVQPGVIAEAWSYRSPSGPVRSKIGSLRQYNLLEKEGDSLRLSDLAIEIVAHPGDSKEYLEAIQKAALSPDLFSRVYSTHKHASDTALRAYLLTKEGFSDRAVRRFIPAYRDAMSLAKLDSDTSAGGQEEPSLRRQPGKHEDEKDGGNTKIIHPKLEHKTGMNNEIFTLEEGEVTLQWPSHLSQESYDDFKAWLDLIARKAKRAVQKELEGGPSNE